MGERLARTLTAEVEDLVTRLGVPGRVLWKQNAKGEFVVAIVLASDGTEQFVAYDHGGEMSFHRDHPRPGGKALLIQLEPEPPGRREHAQPHAHLQQREPAEGLDRRPSDRVRGGEDRRGWIGQPAPQATTGGTEPWQLRAEILIAGVGFKPASSRIVGG